MGINSDDKYFIAFSSIEEVGGVFIKTILDIKGSAKSAWEADEKDFYNSGLRKSSVQTFLQKTQYWQGSLTKKDWAELIKLR